MSRACEREEVVVRAVLEGGPTAALREHLAGCESCREAAAITGWMREVAAAAREAAAEGLPDPAEIWWRAEVLERVERRRALAREAVRPIAVFERWGGVAAAAVAGVLLWLRADVVTGWLAEAGVATILTDPSVLPAVGAGAAAVIAVSTGVLMGRLRAI